MADPIYPLLRRIFSARPDPIPLTADEADLLDAYLATLPPPATTVTGTFGRYVPPPPSGPSTETRRHLRYVLAVARRQHGDAVAVPPGETERPKGGRRAKRISRPEAEVLVREWLAQHAREDPASITRDAVAEGTGVSTGMVSQTAAWRAFQERRKSDTKPKLREIPLTDAMRAVVPSNSDTPDELAALIEEQEADAAEDSRRHKRRHRPS